MPPEPKKKDTLKAPPQKDNKKPILRISVEGAAAFRRALFFGPAEKGENSRLTVLAPAI